ASFAVFDTRGLDVWLADDSIGIWFLTPQLIKEVEIGTKFHLGAPVSSGGFDLKCYLRGGLICTVILVLGTKFQLGARMLNMSYFLLCCHMHPNACRLLESHTVERKKGFSELLSDFIFLVPESREATNSEFLRPSNIVDREELLPRGEVTLRLIFVVALFSRRVSGVRFQVNGFQEFDFKLMLMAKPQEQLALEAWENGDALKRCLILSDMIRAKSFVQQLLSLNGVLGLKLLKFVMEAVSFFEGSVSDSSLCTELIEQFFQIADGNRCVAGCVSFIGSIMLWSSVIRLFPAACRYSVLSMYPPEICADIELLRNHYSSLFTRDRQTLSKPPNEQYSSLFITDLSKPPNDSIQITLSKPPNEQ
ncbi:hypothetical protein Prudu_003358, partial [Prunus dulcis]